MSPEERERLALEVDRMLRARGKQSSLNLAKLLGEDSSPLLLALYIRMEADALEVLQEAANREGEPLVFELGGGCQFITYPEEG